MAFPALLSELYEVFHRKVGADERPASVVAEAAVIEDARFRSIDKRFDALSHTMDQRFDALSQRFDVLNQPSDGLSRVLDQRFGTFSREMVLNQPSDGLSRVMDQRFDALNRAMDQRFGTPRLRQKFNPTRTTELTMATALEPCAEPGYNVKRELGTLEELWLEQLAPYGERGYNTRPK